MTNSCCQKSTLCLCCFLSFLSLFHHSDCGRNSPSKHAFLSTLLYQHALCTYSRKWHIPQFLLAVLGMRGKTHSLRWLSCTAWLLGFFMWCPWKDELLHFHSFCEEKLQPDCLVIHVFSQHITVVKCSGLIFLSLLFCLLCHLMSAFSVQAQKTVF